MYFNHKIFNTFSKDLNLKWHSLHDGKNPFSSFSFHKSIYEVNIQFKKKDYKPMIFCIYDENGNIIAILPFEKFLLSKTLIFHGSEFVDYGDFIFSKNVELNSLGVYIKNNILNKYDLFLHSFEKNNKFLNIISSISKHNISWNYSKRFYIDSTDYPNFFQKKKNFIKKNEKVIKKNSLTIKRINSIQEKLKYLAKHIEYKSIQYKLTKTRNPFHNKKYKKFLTETIENFGSKIDIYLLLLDEKVESILITLIEKNKLCYYQPSYLRNSKLESPGKILMYMAIKIAEEKKLEFDYSTGDEKYKKQYSSNYCLINSFYLSDKIIFNFFHLIYFWIFFYKRNRNTLRRVNTIFIKLSEISKRIKENIPIYK